MEEVMLDWHTSDQNRLFYTLYTLVCLASTLLIKSGGPGGKSRSSDDWWGIICGLIYTTGWLAMPAIMNIKGVGEFLAGLFLVSCALVLPGLLFIALSFTLLAFWICPFAVVYNLLRKPEQWHCNPFDWVI